MTPVELSRTVLRAVRSAVDQGELSVTVPERAVVTTPGPGGCGDYATNIALQLARPAGQSPRRVAEVLRPHLARSTGVTGVDITGPGFLNISLDQGAVSVALVRRILREGLRYGHSEALAGQVVTLRIPYDIRAEVVADALVRIIGSQSGRVEVEHGEPVNLRPVPAPEDPAPLGLDAARWALLHPAPHGRPRITADHLVQRESNPLFRVRYAHARTRAAVRNAADLGFTSEPGPVGDADALLAALADHPRVLGAAAIPPRGSALSEAATAPAPALALVPAPQGSTLIDVAPAPRANTADVAPAPRANTPHATSPTHTTHATRPDAPSRLTRHLLTVADATLPFLLTVLPRGDEKPSAAHRARLALAEAAGTVLAGGLSLLGIDAPDHL
ncbi:ArgS-related anticodon-binding protein NrtL [Streptomyces sp. NPDC001315]|uniref:ArgS-related anticodon-binding protein NrtL n=1 Tax=Streptomyces sp. NPDC001315 TaxID=3364562 RepID=UPI003692F89D